MKLNYPEQMEFNVILLVSSKAFKRNIDITGFKLNIQIS